MARLAFVALLGLAATRPSTAQVFDVVEVDWREFVEQKTIQVCMSV